MRVHSSEFGVYSSLKTANRLIPVVKGRRAGKTSESAEKKKSMAPVGELETNHATYRALTAKPLLGAKLRRAVSGGSLQQSACPR